MVGAPSGSPVTDIRPLTVEVGLVPGAHGSGLFQRGETQVLNVATLGVIYVYPTVAPLPEKVTVEWDMFTEKMSVVAPPMSTPTTLMS